MRLAALLSAAEARPFDARHWNCATLGDGRGFEDSTLNLGRILNNRYGIDAHAATATAWNTSIRYYGGHFACGTGINPGLDRFGVRF
jgi:hypothetical protein